MFNFKKGKCMKNKIRLTDLSRFELTNDEMSHQKGGFCENNLHTDGWWQYCNLNLLRGI
jgi:hypothetical protein